MRRFRFAFPLLFIVIVVFFQNCKTQFGVQSHGSADIDQLKAYSGNGEPYGGKLTFYSLVSGYSCMNSDGVSVASPLGQITQESDGLYLQFEDCNKAQQKIDPSQYKFHPDNSNILIFNNKSFIKIDQPLRLEDPNFFFPEAICNETAESFQQRAGTMGIVLDEEGESVTENRINADMLANWFGVRKANVASIDYTRVYYPLTNPPKIQPVPRLIWSSSFFDISREALNKGWHWFSDIFNLEIYPPPDLPVMMGPPPMLGEMSFRKDGQEAEMTVGVHCILLN